MYPTFFLLCALCATAFAAQYSITQYNIVAQVLSPGAVITSSTYTYTTTYRLYPPATTTPTGSPTSSSVSTDTSRDAEYTTFYYPAANVQQPLLASLSSSASASTGYGALSSTYTYTSFLMPITYTAPSSCITPFTFATTTNIYVPTGAETNLSPYSLNTTTSRGTAVYVTALLSANAVTIASTTTSPGYIYSDYVASCSNPSSYGFGGARATSRPVSGGYPGTSSSGSGSGYYYGSYYYDNCLGSLCPFWLIYIVVIIPILGFFFLAGLLESYFWFTKLMKGQFALRGVPVMWVCLSLWTLCCLRRKRAAQPQHQQALLKQWREMSAGTHLKLWFKYGFRHRDPPELLAITGAPDRAVPVWQSFGPQPGVAQYYGPSQYYSGPPPNGQAPPPGAPNGAVAGGAPMMTEQKQYPNTTTSPVYQNYYQPPPPNNAIPPTAGGAGAAPAALHPGTAASPPPQQPYTTSTSPAPPQQYPHDPNMAYTQPQQQAQPQQSYVPPHDPASVGGFPQHPPAPNNPPPPQQGGFNAPAAGYAPPAGPPPGSAS